MGVKTIYELRVIVKIDGFADIVNFLRFDELESDVARVSYDREVSRAKTIISKERAYKTVGFNEISGIVRRVCVELLSGKTDSATFNSPMTVVGAKDEDPGCSFVVTDRVQSQNAPEQVREALKGLASVGRA